MQVLGPYVGALDNGGEAIELYRPDRPQTSGPDVGYVPQILVERVRYDNHVPWPTLAAGSGAALLRRDPWSYGNEPDNWYTDLDNDGIADDWEGRYQLSPFFREDAQLDNDDDGLSNLEEFNMGSDPWIPNDQLRTDVLLRGEALELSFTAMPGWSYQVYYAEALTGAWILYHQEPASSETRTLSLSDPITQVERSRFYRVTGQPPQ
jgi:hypothetical protein